MSRIGRTVAALWGVVTPLGRVALALGVAAWIGAWATGWAELATLAAVVLAAVALAVLFTFGRNDYRIELTLRPQRVTIGERAGGQMVVRNAGARRSLPVTVELTIGVARASFRVPSLASEAGHDELFTVPTIRRAVIPVGPVTTVRGDPIGLLRRERQWAEVTELYVHPRTATLDRLGSGFLRDLEGQTTQDLSTSDVAFHTLREYVPGDDRRHVHWKTTARVGTLMVRQFVDTRRSFLSVLVSCDLADYANGDEFELAVSMAASLGVKALRDDQTVTLIAGGRTLGTGSPTALLDSSAGIEAGGPARGLDAAIAEANRTAADASIVAIAVGNARSLADVRASITRLKSDARVLVLRADLDGVAAFHTFGETTIVAAPTLDEYSQILFQVSQS